MQISPTPVIKKFRLSNSIEIIASDIALSFQAQGFKHAVGFARAAYQILPAYSAIDSFEIDEAEVITPESVKQLMSNIPPELIESKVQMKVSKIHIQD
jgi:hypothetical protein